MSESIKSLEAKIKSNEKLLMETITKVCEGKDVNKGVILSSIMYDNFDKYSYVNNSEKELFLKLSVINKEFNKVQKTLNVKLDYEKCENILNKIKYNIFEDITKNNIDYKDNKTIDKIRDYSNEALKKIYENRHIDIHYIKPDANGLLIRDENNKSFINNVSYDKDLLINIEPEAGQNALTRGDRLAIFTIAREFDRCLEIHFSEIKHDEFNFKK